MRLVSKKEEQIKINNPHSQDDHPRRQTAEEREQERQAATKYFLSMQVVVSIVSIDIIILIMAS